MLEVHRTGASPRAGGDGGGEQARPVVEGPRQLHAAGVVARKGAVSSSSGLPGALDGLCTGHLSRSLNHTREQISDLSSSITLITPKFQN